MKIFPGHDPIYPTDPRYDATYKLCEEMSLPLVIHSGWNSGAPEVAKFNDPELIARVARQHPTMKIVIAHFFWPEVDYCWEVTRKFSNIYYDTSALADNEVVEATGRDRIKNVLTRVLASNPTRVLFGTDYAMCNRPDHVALIEELPISESVRKAVLCENARELFQLPVAE